ncbi:cilia- and flagella-associated protein 65-like [Limulus polyphemus]|uniref:Cilia- and flagella-associated protein 65-like n=1 Tax=Limulus polyphemus TaxID=6850 RepID=A0ABM1SPA9_LIMPO|nr:cilia- and flagella-associated protein 65-like [Limulus polyphemus]
MFDVTFDPASVNKVFSSVLECYLSATDEFNDDSHILNTSSGYCVKVIASGHTCLNTNVISEGGNCLAMPKHVILEVSSLSQVCYSTVLLINNYSTDLLFECICQNARFSIHCLPQTGIVPAGKHYVLLMKSGPQHLNLEGELQVRGEVSISFTGKDVYYKQVVSVIRNLVIPRLLISDVENGFIFFPSGCIGCKVEITTKLYNTCSIPLRFEWHTDEAVLSVKPHEGLIPAGDSCVLTLVFKPEKVKKYEVGLNLCVFPMEGTSQSNNQAYLACCSACFPELKAEPSLMEFGDVLIDRKVEFMMVVHNPGDCAVSFLLSNKEYTGDCDVLLPKEKFFLPAHCHLQIMIIICPKTVGTRCLEILGRFLTESGDPLQIETVLCQVYYLSVMPYLQICDVHCHGSKLILTKACIRKYMQVDRFNLFMRTYRPDQNSEDWILWDMGATCLGHKPIFVKLAFQNPSSFAANWKLIFPKDESIEPEQWTEPVLSVKEEMRLQALEKVLFNIKPQRGVLKSGEISVLTLVFNPKQSGNIIFPLRLSIANGPCLKIEIKAVSILPETAYILFDSPVHAFTPIPLDLMETPVQFYQLVNAGTQDLQFDIHLEHPKNNDHVIQCLENDGDISPGRVKYVPFRFFPLEAKTYLVNASFQFDGKMETVMFQEDVFDPRTIEATCAISSCSDKEHFLNFFSQEDIQLSRDVIFFGNIPVRALERRIVVITNNSMRDIHFFWHPVDILGVELLIDPKQGLLAAGDKITCKVMIYCISGPTIVEVDLCCTTELFTLWLHVSAFIHSIKSFSAKFPNDIFKFFIKRGSLDTTTDNTTEVTHDDNIQYVEEAQVIFYVLEDLLRDVLEDDIFLKKVAHVISYPIPYFIQLKQSDIQIIPNIKGDSSSNTGNQDKKEVPHTNFVDSEASEEDTKDINYEDTFGTSPCLFNDLELLLESAVWDVIQDIGKLKF